MTAVTNQNDTKIATLEQKLQLCDDFLTATLSLKKAIENHETQAMTDIIKRRELLIATIDGLDRRMTRYARAGSVDRRSAIVRQMDKITGELNVRLKQIVSANQQCEAIAAGRCEELRNEMININRKEELIQGYARGTQRMPKFLNIRT